MGLQILHNDHHCIVVNKLAGIPVQQDQSGDRSLLDMVKGYCKSKIYLVHRIDRPVSGLVIFAKRLDALEHLNQQFANQTIQKKYLAIVPKMEIAQENKLIHYLVRDAKRKKAIVVNEVHPKGKKSILDYQIMGAIEHYQLLSIRLETGRFHQIRAQLSAIGCPVKGDVKYGAKRGNKDRAIDLHARSLAFIHPSTGRELAFNGTVPDSNIWKAFLGSGIDL